MNETGISAEEACRNHALTEKDFTNMCNEDGSPKNQSSTTFTLKDNPSRSVTIDNMVMYAAGVGLILIIACMTVVLVRRRGKKKQ